MAESVKIVIPEKLYFKIGEVAKIVGVEPYVLRYWETEFSEIVPPKSRGKQRLYRRKDIEQIIAIKQLLYSEKFTIDGARRRLKNTNGRGAHAKQHGSLAASALSEGMSALRTESQFAMSKEFLLGMRRKLSKLIDALQ